MSRIGECQVHKCCHFNLESAFLLILPRNKRFGFDAWEQKRCQKNSLALPLRSYIGVGLFQS